MKFSGYHACKFAILLNDDKTTNGVSFIFSTSCFGKQKKKIAWRTKNKSIKQCTTLWSQSTAKVPALRPHIIQLAR